VRNADAEFFVVIYVQLTQPRTLAPALEDNQRFFSALEVKVPNSDLPHHFLRVFNN